MSNNTYYIEHDGKQLRTFNELKDWYLNAIKAKKKANPDFNECLMAETERQHVVTIINELIPTDNESRLFKKALFQYLINFLYSRAKSVFYPSRLPNDIFLEHLSWFNQRFEVLTDENLQKKLIQNEIERYERISLDWSQHVDISDPLFEPVFDAGQMFLSHLKTKITNYQHTPIASGHEKIVEHYTQYSYGLPVDNNEILLAEELENHLIIEGVGYKHALSDHYMSLKFDEAYFKKFIPGTLFRGFTQGIFDRIHLLNDYEIDKFLTLSLEQFQLFNPTNREQEFIQKFAKAYWHPNGMDKVYEEEERAAKFILKEFALHYSLFISATQKSLNNHITKIRIPVIPPTSNNYTVSHFFENVKDGLFTKLEFHNKVEKITDNFNLEKLEILYEDFELFIDVEREDWIATFTPDEIQSAIKELESKKKQIPYLKINTTLNGKIVNGSDNKVIDLEELLFPDELEPCYQFKNFLTTEINKRKAPKPPPNGISKSNVKDTFDSILTQPKQDFILKMLEDLSITTDGKPVVGNRNKSALLGIVQALLEKCILPKKSEFVLCKLIGSKIGLELTTKLGQSFTSKEMRKSALIYITSNYKL